MLRMYLISLLLLLGACGQTDTDEQMAGTQESQPETYAEAYAAAVAAIKIAAGKRHAWTSSDALLKKSQAAAENGETERAIQLANEARLLGELAARQADTEKTDWQERTLP